MRVARHKSQVLACSAERHAHALRGHSGVCCSCTWPLLKVKLVAHSQAGDFDAGTFEAFASSTSCAAGACTEVLSLPGFALRLCLSMLLQDSQPEAVCGI